MPRLVDDGVLEGLDVVANAEMNRGRGLRGVNSHERELGLDPLVEITRRLDRAGSAGVGRRDGSGGTREAAVPIVTWLDVCCGEGRALAAADAALREAGRRDDVGLIGLDLVDAPGPPGVSYAVGSVLTWAPPRPVDLVTCVHGLHYVGDKLAALTRLVSWLAPGGRFAANFDPIGVCLDGAPAARSLTQLLRAAGLAYDSRNRRISCDGPRTLTLPFAYVGADPAAGPNYTGQSVVGSHYQRSRL